MNASKTLETTIVVRNHVVSIKTDLSSVPTAITMTLQLDDGRARSFEEPGWRELRYGTTGDRFYWWSARRLVAMSTTSGDVVLNAETDEDILLVFSVDDRWLLVCETSIRLFVSGHEVDRLEMPDVLTESWWDGSSLNVHDAAGHVAHVTLVDNKLESTGL